MAQKVQVVLVDDLDGSAGPTVETVSFGLDGTHYEIDLSKKNAQKLRTSLSGYLTVARATKANGTRRPKPKKSGSRRVGSNSTGSRPEERSSAEAKTVRLWAAEQGIEVPAQGRIPKAVQEQYAAAH